MGTIVVCVLNVDLGANFFWFLSVQCNILHGTEYKSLAACVCVSVYLRVSAHGTGGRISRKRLKIEPRFQWDNSRKWHMANRLVTWSMTSRGLEMSSLWPQYLWDPLSRKWLEIQTRLQQGLQEMAPRVSNGHLTGDVSSSRSSMVSIESA